MNTFGTSTLKFQLCAYDERLRKRFRREPLIEKANTFCCGRDVSRGYILLPRYEYVQLDTASSAFELTIGDITLKNLSIVQAQCVSTGLIADANSLYLIELTDARGVLSNRWFQYPVNVQYNMRAPAYPELYYTGSLNGVVPWTWDTMVEDLWPSLLGAYPGLPITPLGTPERWQFIGIPVLEALYRVFDHLGLVLAVDHTQAAAYTIVVDDAADADFATLQTLYTQNLEDDLQWLDAGNGRFPGSVTVYFRLRQEQYGQEETVRRDSRQWTSTPLYEVSVATAYPTSTGRHFLHDDFTVRRDFDSVPLAADVATATAIAAERVAQYMRTIDNFMSQTYAEALPFYVGSQVDEVLWTPSWRTKITKGKR